MQTKNIFHASLAAAFLLVAVSGCRSVRRGEPITGPLPTDEPALARGRTVFEQNCYQCHPGGEGGLGPALNDKPAPGFLIKTQARIGLGAMPCFDKSEISPESLDDLTTYVLALRRDDKKKTQH